MFIAPPITSLVQTSLDFVVVVVLGSTSRDCWCTSPTTTSTRSSTPTCSSWRGLWTPGWVALLYPFTGWKKSTADWRWFRSLVFIQISNITHCNNMELDTHMTITRYKDLHNIHRSKIQLTHSCSSNITPETSDLIVHWLGTYCTVNTCTSHTFW